MSTKQKDRISSSVPNVQRATREGRAARASRKTDLNSARAGTEGSKLNDRVSGAFRSNHRRNS